jgi:hypothetical protein
MERVGAVPSKRKGRVFLWGIDHFTERCTPSSPFIRLSASFDELLLEAAPTLDPAFAGKLSDLQPRRRSMICNERRDIRIRASLQFATDQDLVTIRFGERASITPVGTE